MLRNQIKKLLCLVLVIAMIASLSVAAFAADSPMNQAQDCIVNMVKNVLSHENVILKELVRVPFRAAAAVGYALGLRTAAELLNHSLQDEPTGWTRGADSQYAEQIKKAEEVRNILTLTAGNAGQIRFESDLDLYLSYHGMNYTVGDGTITFEDDYNFAPMSWGEPFSLHSIVAILNNFAFFAQEIHAINEYPISVTVDK